jgi:inner membrane protein
MTLTHLAISGLMTSLMVGTADPLVVSVGAIAGLLPDVDLSKSPAGRILFPISSFLEKRFPHRSCTHSILASIVVGAVVYGLAYGSVISWRLAHAIEIGYTFGYLVDLITKSGIQLFFPTTLRCVVPGNRNLRLSTGSNWEYGILVLVVAALLLVLNINTHGGMGFTFNEILATPRGVQELMNQKGNSHQIIVHIDGVRTFDRSRINGDFAVIEQKDANTFIVTPQLPILNSQFSTLNSPELYQVSNRPDMGHQIVSERITGKVGRKITTRIESVTWVDEEILPKLNQMIDRYPKAMMYLTGSIDIDDPEQISIQAKPQQLATAIKQGRKLEFNSCSLTVALNLLREQWGSGQVRIRVVLNNN